MLTAERILKAFEKSMAEYEPAQKSKHWEGWFGRTKHLYKAEFLENFRNNTLSAGLDDQAPPQGTKEIFCDLLAEVGEEFVFSNLSTKNIGNSRQVFMIGEKVVDAGQAFHIKWLHDLVAHVFSQRDVKYMCESGGGYGSLAQKIRSNIKCRYIMIDLPEANVLSSCYLSTHFPDMRFLLADEVAGNAVNKEQIDQYDFVIVPPWYEIKGVAIDLFINTRSMMEMNMEAIKKYFDFIQGAVSPNGFFFNINRYYKDSVGYPIKLSEYPYDEKWNVVLSKPAWRQPIIHCLLTRRTEGKGTIREELNKIERIYQENRRVGREGFVKTRTIVVPGKRAVLCLPFKFLKAILPPSLYRKLKEAIISQL